MLAALERVVVSERAAGRQGAADGQPVDLPRCRRLRDYTGGLSDPELSLLRTRTAAALNGLSERGALTRQGTMFLLSEARYLFGGARRLQSAQAVGLDEARALSDMLCGLVEGLALILEAHADQPSS